MSDKQPVDEATSATDECEGGSDFISFLAERSGQSRGQVLRELGRALLIYQRPSRRLERTESESDRLQRFGRRIA